MHEHRPSSSEYTDIANALCYRFLPFFLPSLNSPVITDINKCILYKTMYKFHSTRSPPRTADDDSRALPFTFTPKYKIIVDLPFFLFFVFSFFQNAARQSFAICARYYRTPCVPRFLIVKMTGSTKRGTIRAIYI